MESSIVFDQLKAYTVSNKSHNLHFAKMNLNFTNSEIFAQSTRMVKINSVWGTGREEGSWSFLWNIKEEGDFLMGNDLLLKKVMTGQS